jgi:hypothetical protein
MAEFTASYRRRQTVMADTNLLIDPSISKVILSFSHSSDYNTDALVLIETLDVFAYVVDWRLPRERHLAAVWREVLSDGVFDDTKEFLGRCGGADRELVEKLNHETCETLECTRNAHGWIYFDKDTFGRLDVDLELAGLVERRIQER